MVYFHPNNSLMAAPLNLLNNNVCLLDRIVDFAAKGEDGKCDKSILCVIQLTCKAFEKLVIGKILLLSYWSVERPLSDSLTNLNQRKLQIIRNCSQGLPVIVHLQSYIARGGDPKFVFKTALSKLTDRDVVTRASIVHLFWLFTRNRICPASRSFTTAAMAFLDPEDDVRRKAVDICTALIQRGSYIKKIVLMASTANVQDTATVLVLFQKLVKNNYGIEPATRAAIRACPIPDPKVRVEAVKLLNALMKRNKATNKGFKCAIYACKDLVENVTLEALGLFQAHFEKNPNVENAVEVAARACLHTSSRVRFEAVAFIRKFVERNYAAAHPAVTLALNALPEACADLDYQVTNEVIELFWFLIERDCGLEQALVVTLRVYASPYTKIRPEAMKLLLALVERNYQLEKVVMVTSQVPAEITIDDVELCSLLFKKNHGIEQASQVALQAAINPMCVISEAGIKLLISLFENNHGVAEALEYAKYLENRGKFSNDGEQLRFCIFLLKRGHIFENPPLGILPCHSIESRVEYLEALVKNGQGVERAIECLHSDIPIGRYKERSSFYQLTLRDELFVRLRSAICESEKSMRIVVAYASQMSCDLIFRMNRDERELQFDPKFREIAVVMDLLYDIAEQGFYLKEIAACLSKITSDVDAVQAKVLCVYRSLVNKDFAVINAACLVEHMRNQVLKGCVSEEAVKLLSSLVVKGYALKEATEALRHFASTNPLFANCTHDHVYELCTALLEKNCNIFTLAIRVYDKVHRITMKKLELLLALVNRHQAIDLAFDALAALAADKPNIELQPVVITLIQALKKYDFDGLIGQFSNLTIVEQNP